MYAILVLFSPDFVGCEKCGRVLLVLRRKKNGILIDFVCIIFFPDALLQIWRFTSPFIESSFLMPF